MKEKVLLILSTLIMVLSTMAMNVFAAETINLERNVATIPTNADNLINFSNISSCSSNKEGVYVYKEPKTIAGVNNKVILSVDKKAEWDNHTYGDGKTTIATFHFENAAKVYDLKHRHIVLADVKIEILKINMKNKISTSGGAKDNTTGETRVLTMSDAGKIWVGGTGDTTLWNKHFWYGPLEVSFRLSIIPPGDTIINTSKVVYAVSDVDHKGDNGIIESVSFDDDYDISIWKNTKLVRNGNKFYPSVDLNTTGNDSWYNAGVMAHLPKNKTSLLVTHTVGGPIGNAITVYTGYEETAPFKIQKKIDSEGDLTEGEHVGLEGFKFKLKSKYSFDEEEPESYVREYSGVTNAEGVITSWKQEIPEDKTGEDAHPFVQEIPIGEYLVSEDIRATDEFEEKYRVENKTEEIIYNVDGKYKKIVTTINDWETVTEQNTVVNIKANESNSLDWINRFNKKIETDEYMLEAPTIRTEMTGDNNSHQLPNEIKVNATDLIEYSGLKPGIEYSIMGELVDVATGEKTGIKGNTSFVPQNEDGTTTVKFVIDTTEYENKNLVAYEHLVCNDKIIAKHDDINNKDQTVKIGKIAKTFPKTGDNSKLFIYVITLVIAIIGISCMIICQRKNKKDTN